MPSASPIARICHVLRHITLLLTALALAGASVLSPASEKVAWLLVDASASMEQLEDESLALAREAIAAQSGMRKTGVIAFGRQAMVESPLSEAPVYHGSSTIVDASASNLEQALSLALALTPSEASGGLAVISDGRVEDINFPALEARSIPVNAALLSAGDRPDAQITRVDAPASAYQGQQISVTVTVHATASGDATILLLANGSAAATRSVTLRKGENAFVFQLSAATPGVTTLEAQVIMADDEVSQNNRSGALIAISGAPSILLVEGQNGAGSELEKLLRASGMTVEVRTPAALPHNAAILRAWHAVAMVNVDADSLEKEQLSALSDAVRRWGLGLAVFGGDSSYALGGYRGSMLEDLLPVTIDVKNRMELPSTALLLVIDKSGSMVDGQWGVSRLDVAKEAACRSLEVLTEHDLAGVIAFDDAGKWVLPLMPVTDIPAMQEEIAAIVSGGGTAFYTPLVMAYETLRSAEAQHKHVIFLTDGQSGDQGYEDIASAMAQEGITLTTVAVGSGADLAIMAELAQRGGGRAYAAGEFDNVPKIFTKETMLISGAYVHNRTFTPVVTDASLTDFDGFPLLSGYLAVTEKPLSTVSLVSDREDPILAWWTCGAGRVLCWTSDVQGAWSSAFLSWEEATAFFGNMLSHVLTQKTHSGEMTIGNGMLHYTAAVSADQVQAQAQVLTPDGSTQMLSLAQTGPFTFEAPLSTDKPGAYAVEITLSLDGEPIATLSGGAVTPYAAEYDILHSESGALSRLTQKTGGVLTASAEELLSFPETAAQARLPLRPWLLMLALMLLLIDIALHRLGRVKRRVSTRQAPVRTPSAEPAPSLEEKPLQAAEQLWQNLQKRNRM